MKTVRWDKQKNEWLKKERGISFEDVEFIIENNDQLDILENPNQDRYPGQKCFIINVDNYVYVVPFAENDSEIFLKTIYASRKLTKKYLE